MSKKPKGVWQRADTLQLGQILMTDRGPSEITHLGPGFLRVEDKEGKRRQCRMIECANGTWAHFLPEDEFLIQSADTLRSEDSNLQENNQP